jgi:hypothetical protein
MVIIRPAQLRALSATSRSAVVAAVAARLREAYGVTLEEVEDERLAALVDAAVAHAAGRGVAHSASLFVYVSLAVLWGEDFETLAGIAPLLAPDGRSLDDRLRDLPANIGPAVWQSAGAPVR